MDGNRELEILAIVVFQIYQVTVPDIQQIAFLVNYYVIAESLDLVQIFGLPRQPITTITVDCVGPLGIIPDIGPFLTACFTIGMGDPSFITILGI